MNGLNSLFKTFLLILFVFGFCGWLLRDHFQLRRELAAAEDRNADLQAQLHASEQALDTTEQQLAEAQARLHQLEQEHASLIQAYTDLQNKATLEAQNLEARIATLESELLNTRALIAQQTTEMSQYQLACEDLRQNMTHELQVCRAASPAAGSQAMSGQQGGGDGNAAGGLTAAGPNGIIGASLLIIITTAGAAGVVIDRSRLSRGVARKQAPPARRTGQGDLKPLVLRRKQRASHHTPD